jgi:Fe-S cluster assembly protein SufD
LLLSGDAEIDTKPELEIYADEVKCSHGATVGQLDESALFYLRSRGLDEAEATRLITRAFASKVLSLLTVGATRDYVAHAIDERLDTLIGDNHDE